MFRFTQIADFRDEGKPSYVQLGEMSDRKRWSAIRPEVIIRTEKPISAVACFPNNSGFDDFLHLGKVITSAFLSFLFFFFFFNDYINLSFFLSFFFFFFFFFLSAATYNAHCLNTINTVTIV